VWRCRVDYYELFAPKCGGCGHPISEQFITALNQQWHTHCFVCAVSSTLLTLSADACMGGVILPLPQLQPIPSPLSQQGLDTAIPPTPTHPVSPVPAGLDTAIPPTPTHPVSQCPILTHPVSPVPVGEHCPPILSHPVPCFSGGNCLTTPTHPSPLSQCRPIRVPARHFFSSPFAFSLLFSLSLSLLNVPSVL